MPRPKVVTEPGARGTADPEGPNRFDDDGAPVDESPEPVSREELLAALEEFGMDVGVITDAVPDEVLGEMVRLLVQRDAADADYD
jgi:hypothetical protein